MHYHHMAITFQGMMVKIKKRQKEEQLLIPVMPHQKDVAHPKLQLHDRAITVSYVDTPGLVEF